MPVDPGTIYSGMVYVGKKSGESLLSTNILYSDDPRFRHYKDLISKAMASNDAWFTY